MLLDQLQDVRDFTVFDWSAICACGKARQDIARYDFFGVALAKDARVRRRGPLFVKGTFDFDFVYANGRSLIIHDGDFCLPAYEFLIFSLRQFAPVCFVVELGVITPQNTSPEKRDGAVWIGDARHVGFIQPKFAFVIAGFAVCDHFKFGQCYIRCVALPQVAITPGCGDNAQAHGFIFICSQHSVVRVLLVVCGCANANAIHPRMRHAFSESVDGHVAPSVIGAAE